MYPQWVYVGLLAAALGASQLAAAFGGPWQVYGAYATTLVLGVVVFYQNEARVTRAPVVASVLVALFAGTVASLLVAAGLVTYVLDSPLDFALWRVGLVMFDTWLAVGFALLGAFFLVGFLSALV